MKNPTKEHTEYENCIACGKQTSVRSACPIEMREAYLYGAGQLCHDCYRKLLPEMVLSDRKFEEAYREQLAQAEHKQARASGQ